MGSIAGSLSRNRQQSETKNVYNPDLEYSQQGYANAMYGPGAPIGSYGMSGGQYPTANKDPAGFGSGGYGYPGQYHGTGSNSQGYQGSMDSRSGWQRARDSGFGANPSQFGAAGDAARGLVEGRSGSYWGPGNTGQPGAGNVGSNGGRSGNIGPGGYGQPGQGVPVGGGSSATGVAQGYGDPANGGSYQWGNQQGGQGYGDYSAMQPYQWGSQGAQGDLNAAGGAAYSGFGSLGQQYAQMGQQGVTPAERSNLMAASNEAVQSNLAASRDQIANRAAASGNTAGVAGAQARLGATSGQQLESADRANQLAILQENQRRKEAGLAGQTTATQGQAGLYGTSSGYMQGLLGGRSRLASLQQRGYTSGAGTGGTFSGQGNFGG